MKRFLKVYRHRRASDITVPVSSRRADKNQDNHYQLSLSALNTRRRNRWNHQKESSRSCVSTSPGSLKGAPYREGQGPSRMKDLTEATLFPCHLLFGIVRISTASQCLQVLRMKAPCAATMGLVAPNRRNVISWLFQPQNLPEQGLYLQSLGLWRLSQTG